MSGDTAFLRTTADSFFARAFGELERLPADDVPWALVGGLAVGARLAMAHRATKDIDAVSPRNSEFVELLVRAQAIRRQGRVWLHDVPVDSIPVPGSGRGRLPAARQWAYDGATPLSIVVLAPDGTALATAQVPVATRAGLVLLKLESAVHAFDRSPDKQATDIYDVLRLVAPAIAELTAALASAPAGLRADAAQCARARLLRDPAATRNHLSDAQRDEFTVADMRTYGDVLATLLIS